ncbi:MAG: hypothetical protein M1816_005955 [Peltula sp. TS41687]|nr:MAG: hypothetical protein M1816_005955 [Peltula sp. TS41687]
MYVTSCFYFTLDLSNEANMNKKSEQLNVPKFASFRPKAKVGSVEESSSRRDSTGDVEAARESHKNHRRHERRHHRIRGEHVEGDEHHRRHRSDVSKTKEQTVRKVDRDELQTVERDDLQNWFQIDRKGDPHNAIYGTIHRYNIPDYHRWGAGSVVGLPKRLKIDRDPDERGITIDDRHSNRPGKREKYSFARNERKPTRKLQIRREEPLLPNELRDDFVPLNKHGSLKRALASEDELLVSGDDDDGHYRSIEGKAKPRSGGIEKDLEYASESSSDYEPINLDSSTASARARNMELSNKVDLDPSNVRSWLDLIDHQDALLGLRGEGSGGRQATEAEKRSTANIKLSLYDKALSKVDKRADGYERLLMGMMEEGPKIWDFKIQTNKWRALLGEHPHSIDLWTKYLDFQQTNFRTFTYEGHCKVYVDCVEVLKMAMVRAQDTIQDTCKLEAILAYVILRSTLMIREAGYTENAVAIWQALLEVNFFTSERILAQDQPIRNGFPTSFEEFWDSEAPRIGEVDAKGWHTYVESNDLQPSSGDSTQLSKIRVDENNIFQSWLAAEKQQSLSSRNPDRTVDDLQDDDPYRVVFFSDIKDLLIYLPNPRFQMYLINAFLAFCHLPPLPSVSAGDVSFWWTNSFVRTEALEQSHAFLNAVVGRANSEDLSTGESTDATSSYSRPVLFKFPNFTLSTETLFAQTGRWYNWLESWKAIYGDGEGPVDVSWIQRILRSLVTIGVGGSSLSEYCLASELVVSPESARKACKKLLKEHPSSLRLYNAYALIEWRLGNRDKAENVYSTALGMCASLSEYDKRDDILLWRSWVWEVLEEDCLQEALSIILSIPEASPPKSDLGSTLLDSVGSTQIPPTALLKAKKTLQAGLESTASSTNTTHSVDYADLLALLAYLSQNRSIEASLDEYAKASEFLSNRPLAFELLHQSKSHLLYHHATHSHHFRPALLRSSLFESIQLFPQNTIFLTLYAWNERRFRIDDRVRSVINDLSLRQGEAENTITIINWIFAVWTESHGSLGAGHNVHSIKAVFERAVTSPSGKSSPTIWALYLLFSIQARLPKPYITSVFYNGIRACPWAKGLYLLAFQYLAPYMDEEELRRVYEVMREKELRIRVELPEVLLERVGRATT